MNKQIDNKAVEEMAKIIANKMCYAFIDGRCSLDGSACDLICRSGDEYKECAKALYNAGYTQKVNEGDIVLTKEENKQMLKDLFKSQEIGEKIVEERTRKETAREILQQIKTIWKANNGVLQEYMFDNIGEKYGVEVE